VGIHFQNPTLHKSVVCVLQYATLTRPELALQLTKFANSRQLLFILTGWKSREFYGTLLSWSYETSGNQENSMLIGPLTLMTVDPPLVLPGPTNSKL